ncbi:hypothetical protein HYQ57_2008 [Lactobacillus crispatus]|uniref:hypothetical protein n=1 Tax=Lactobacillus crispatus TaxID=47770 RepID=UPI0018E37183|nr:hypothetical protein [Lactobacillus crispatus]MBI1722270.1 hypothetical protein [Lactobacillus crispatus]
MLNMAIGYAVIQEGKSCWAINFPLLTDQLILLPKLPIETIISILRKRLHQQQLINKQRGITPESSPITNFRLHSQYSAEALQEKYGLNAPIFPIKYKIIF